MTERVLTKALSCFQTVDQGLAHSSASLAIISERGSEHLSELCDSWADKCHMLWRRRRAPSEVHDLFNSAIPDQV